MPCRIHTFSPRLDSRPLPLDPAFLQLFTPHLERIFFKLNAVIFTPTCFAQDRCTKGAASYKRLLKIPSSLAFFVEQTFCLYPTTSSMQSSSLKILKLLLILIVSGSFPSCINVMQYPRDARHFQIFDPTPSHLWKLPFVIQFLHFRRPKPQTRKTRSSSLLPTAAFPDRQTSFSPHSSLLALLKSPYHSLTLTSLYPYGCSTLSTSQGVPYLLLPKTAQESCPSLCVAEVQD